MKGISCGNHTVNHKSMPDIDDQEIKDEIMNLHEALYERYRL